MFLNKVQFLEVVRCLEGGEVCERCRAYLELEPDNIAQIVAVGALVNARHDAEVASLPVG